MSANPTDYTELLSRLNNCQRDSLNLFCTSIKEQNFFKEADLIIFGSLIKGRLYNSSDIDIVVVSDYFTLISWSDRIALLKKYKYKSWSIVNPLGLTFYELESYEYPSIIRVVREQGAKILF